MAACKHESTQKVIAGVPVKWCRLCGSVFDGARWHRHAGHGTHAKRHVQRDAHKAARRVVKRRTPAQKAATERMLAAGRAKRGAR